MRRAFAIFGIPLLVLSFVALLPAKPASADSPLLNWSTSIDDTATNLSLLLGNTDASTNVGWCDYQPANPQKPYILQTFNTDTASQQVPSSTSLRPYICDDLSSTSVVDKNGVIYVKTVDAQGVPTLAKATNNQLTSLGAPPDGCSTCPNAPTIHSMAMGTDENLYILTRQMDSGTYYFSLVKYDTQQHSFGSSMPLFSSPWANVSMGLHQNGIVVSYANNIRYYSFSGTAQSSPLSPPNYMEWDKDVPPVTPDGHTYIGNSQEVTPTSACSLSFVTSSLEVYTTSAHSSINLEACQYLRGIRVTPNNGVVVLLQAANNQQKLVSYDSNGTLKWSKPLVTSLGGRTYGDAIEHTRVDQNGNIILWRDYTKDGARHMQIDSLSGTTGNVLWTADTRDIDDGSSFFQVTRSAALTNNHFYLTMYRCDGAMTSGCTDNPKLYSFNTQGVSMEYPKASFLDNTAPVASNPIKYAALGDSFSSGEGVPPFLEGTDDASDPNNQKVCHRSNLAYPNLIANYPALSIDMEAFVACSGARTDQIIGGWPINDHKNTTEPAQADALTNSTQLVTLSIGGNDIDFTTLIYSCVLAGCGFYADQSIAKAQNELPQKLDEVYDKIKLKAPNAKVYVMGYPNIVPPSLAAAPSSERLPFFACGEITDYDIWHILRVEQELNIAIQQAVSRAGAQFEYIDPNTQGSPFTGHELCTNDRYFNYAQFPDQEYSFHPKENGQRAYAKLFLNNFNPNDL